MQSLIARIWAGRLLSTVSVPHVICWDDHIISDFCLLGHSMRTGLHLSSQQAKAWCSARFTAWADPLFCPPWHDCMQHSRQLCQ